MYPKCGVKVVVLCRFDRGGVLWYSVQNSHVLTIPQKNKSDFNISGTELLFSYALHPWYSLSLGCLITVRVERPQWGQNKAIEKGPTETKQDCGEGENISHDKKSPADPVWKEVIGRWGKESSTGRQENTKCRPADNIKVLNAVNAMTLKIKKIKTWGCQGAKCGKCQVWD